MTEEKDPIGLKTLLQDYGDSSLRRIVRQAQRLLAIDKIFKEYLPENLRVHCQVAQVSATELTIFVDSAAWLTQLRYCKQPLLLQLKKNPQCAYVQNLQYRIQPAQNLPAEVTPALKPKSLSEENKNLLKETAESISHPRLKKALLKLGA
jgi:hypothetical protein